MYTDGTRSAAPLMSMHMARYPVLDARMPMRCLAENTNSSRVNFTPGQATMHWQMQQTPVAL